jgi:hypothetical protein
MRRSSSSSFPYASELHFHQADDQPGRETVVEHVGPDLQQQIAIAHRATPGPSESAFKSAANPAVQQLDHVHQSAQTRSWPGLFRRCAIAHVSI